MWVQSLLTKKYQIQLFQLCQGFFDAVHGLNQLIVAGSIGDPNVSFGSKSRSGNSGHMTVIEKIKTQFGGIGNDFSFKASYKNRKPERVSGKK